MRRSKKAFCPAAAWPCCGPPAAVKPEGLSHDQEVGYNIILRAARAPLTMIAVERRPGRRHRVREGASKAKGNYGYNAATDTYEDLVKAGIIDPTKVTRTALQNASSVATLLLTSDALIAEKPKERQEGWRRPRRRRRHVLIPRARAPDHAPRVLTTKEPGSLAKSCRVLFFWAFRPRSRTTTRADSL